MRITTSGRSKRYALFFSDKLVSSGELSSTDHLATSLDVVAGEDENTFLNTIPVDSLPPLPEQGVWLEADELYSDDGRAVMVRKSHTRTEHAVDDLVPTLFLIYREGAGVLTWVAGESVVVGTRRTYNGTEYTCIQAHITQSDWQPPNVPALWSEIAEAGDEWAAYVDYSVGDVVSYDGTEYECIQAHTAQVGWEPPNVPALWSPV